MNNNECGSRETIHDLASQAAVKTNSYLKGEWVLVMLNSKTTSSKLSNSEATCKH